MGINKMRLLRWMCGVMKKDTIRNEGSSKSGISGKEENAEVVLAEKDADTRTQTK